MSTVETFTRQGIRLALHDGGGRGAPFVFQHGLCGSAAQTAEVMPAIDSVRPMTLECRAHGASEAGDSADFSIATFTDDIEALVAERHLAPVIAGGISMGAAIAARLAVRNPGDVRALVLARPAWVSSPGPENIRPYGEVGELLARYTPQEGRRLFLASATARRLTLEAPDNLASLVGFFDRAPQDGTSRMLSRISRDGPGVTADQISRIACPVLILGHTHDLAHPFAACQELAALIPLAKLVQITPKAVDKAAYIADFKAALAAFLKDVVNGKA